MNEFEHIVNRLKENRLWRFPGGVHPDDKKTLSNSGGIARPPLPEALYIPLKQHIGTEGHCLVNVGDDVLKGQALTNGTTAFSVPVHAPTSGQISAIEEHVSAHPSGLKELTIKLIPDGREEWIEREAYSDYTSLSAEKTIEIICNAGISGLGGAGFPTHIKANSNKPVDFLIINGVECEPYITSDDRLMREHAWQIKQGIDILQHLIQPKMVIVAIEDNKPEAMSALKIACNQKTNCILVSVPTVYPAGGEKQLIQMLTGKEVPGHGLPIDIGVLMFNVGTCFAIADAVCHGKPLIERVVTLTGSGLKQPQNVWVLLGTPVGHLTDFAGLNAASDEDVSIIMGGPMMGFSVSSPNVPVVKITNCLLVPAENELRQGENERPCIRCGACADACPASLLPQQLYWHSKAKEHEKAEKYHLFDCIECGACAYVCPSDIPLVQYYRQAKAAIRNERDEKDKAEKAKQRFEMRKARLEAEKREREERHKQAAEARIAAQAKGNQASHDSNDSNNKNDSKAKPKSAAAAAAIARAKAKKESQGEQETTPREIVESKPVAVASDVEQAKEQKSPPSETKNDSDSKENTKSAAAAAIARAKAKAKAKKEAVSESDNATVETSADEEKKARVAAAVARAKAKALAKAKAAKEE